MRHSVLVLIGAFALAAGAGCSGCNGSSLIGGDGNGRADGGGGGGGGNGQPDAGLDLINGTIQSGGFTLDGGAGGFGSGVQLDPNGNVVLGSGSSQYPYLWIANNDRHWVSKYDTRTGKELGRYWSVIPKSCAASATAGCENPQPIASLRGNAANMPSRTAVDLFGDVWVANRANDIQGSVTKIAGDLSGCIDHNKNGKIDTATDKNGDGQVDATEMITPTDWANYQQYDECVLFSVPLSDVKAGIAARALAVSKGKSGTAGDVWVGHFRDRRVYKLRALNGAIEKLGGQDFIQLASPNWGGQGPYGAIVDGKQRLWLLHPGSARLALVDTATGTVVNEDITPPAGVTCGSYGIGVDGDGRVWLPGWVSGTVACRYDHGPGVGAAVGTWARFDFSAVKCQNNAGFGRPRGIAVDRDKNVYMSSDGTGLDAASHVAGARLIRFDADTGAVKPFGAASCIDFGDANTSNSIGVAVDLDGQPWINNYSGNAVKVDKTTGAVMRTPQQQAGLYTYSDFSGYQLLNFTAPSGEYRKDFAGCSNQGVALWHSLTWDATVPANAKLEVFVRTADTPEGLGLSTATQYGPFTSPPVDLAGAGVKASRYARVRFVLTSSDRKSSPAIKSFTLSWTCSGAIN